MRKIPLTFLALLGSILNLLAQKSVEDTQPHLKSNLVSVGTEIPLGDFSSTHLPGIGIEYARSKNKFGILSITDKRKIAFVYGGGAAIYIGRKETVSLYPYKYPAYIFIKASAGVFYKPSSKSGFTFAAGPAIGIYNGNTQFNIASKLDGSYYMNKKLAITPGIILMKEMTVADPLIAFSLKASLVL